MKITRQTRYRTKQVIYFNGEKAGLCRFNLIITNNRTLRRHKYGYAR